MLSKTWETSQRKYNVLVERDVRILMTDGTEISADIFRPETDEKCPAILGMHAFRQQPQSAPIKPNAFGSGGFLNPGEEKTRGWIEAGDSNFFVRRGYVHVIANVRGTGKSGGKFEWKGPQELRDTYEVIEWIAKQPWCTGKVGMFGVSYFAIIQLLVAALNPPSLKCLFAPHAVTDYYRDQVYRGGILGYKFTQGVAKGYSDPRCESITQKKFGDEEFKKRLANALADEDITAIPGLADILRNPHQGVNPFIVDLLVNPLDGPYWEERKAKHEAIKMPAYIGGCWGNYGLHLPGAFRSWENLKAPKRMVIGPPIYFDRPLYQPQYESLRWFDYWLKGIDTGIMDEAPVRLFVMGTNKWKETSDWPLPETKWIPFYLHEDKLLSEHEHWPNEGADSFEDSPWQRGSLEYCSPTLVEDTEVIGPISLNLYASTTDDEVLWFVSLREVDPRGNEKVLTRGWLRGTHREVDWKRSKRWAPYHPHTRSEPLTPGNIYEFNIAIVPTGNLFKAGSRIKVKISCTDDVPTHAFEEIASGNIRRQRPSRITVFHDAEHPSHLLLPVTSGNVLGTFISGGKPYLNFS